MSGERGSQGHSVGLVLGKFLPLHRGHVALIEFAAKRCDELIVLLGALEGEPIPAVHRLQWLWKTFGNRNNVRIEATVEPLPASGPRSRDVSAVWALYLSRRFPTVRTIFSSEAYGDELAELMQIRHVAFDPQRAAHPVSGTSVRLDVHARWDDLADAAQPYFRKRVALFGPECTGKTTLARQLAERFRTVWVEEKARALVDSRGLSKELFPEILEAQANAVLEAEAYARAFVFCDSDARTTKLYYRFFYGEELAIPPWIEAVHTYDLYLLCDVDLDWDQGDQRFFGHRRKEHFAAFEAELVRSGAPYVVVSGRGERRVENAVRAVEAIPFGPGKTGA